MINKKGNSGIAKNVVIVVLILIMVFLIFAIISGQFKNILGLGI